MMKRLLERACALSGEYLETLPTRPVGPAAAGEVLRASFGGPLPDEPEDPEGVLEGLARSAEPGLVASAGPRFFGFVVGGSLPVALAADWLTSAWDQSAQAFTLSPAAAVVEDAVARWMLDLLDLPSSATVGLVTGAQMANFVGLAAARHDVLRRVGWDVEARGLTGAPPVDILVGEGVHGTVLSALRMLGFGTDLVRYVGADKQGRMVPTLLSRSLAECGPSAIVCAQAGNVNSGASDLLEAVADAVRDRGGWLHVDGAFGLWARVSPRLRDQLAGIERADSWATDAHKWLNVPYDSGIAIVAHPAAHEAAMSGQCAYVGPATEGQRDGMRWVPDNSRRARGFVLYAALRALGRRGVVELVERCCAHARRMAERLAGHPGIRILNEVCLNQVLVRLELGRGAADDDAHNEAVAQRVRADGVCWVGTTTWHGMTVIRISFCNWSTTAPDVDQSADAILAAARASAAVSPTARGPITGGASANEA